MDRKNAITVVSALLDELGSDFNDILAEARQRALGVNQDVAGSGYFITVNYFQSLNQMVEAGHYNCTNFDINERNFPLPKKSGQINLNIELVHFNQNIDSDDVIRELDKMGLRPATLAELLALGAQYPDLQRQFPIVVLDSVWQNPDGSRYVPFLWDDSVRRSLYLDWFDGGWIASCRFAAVRK